MAEKKNALIIANSQYEDPSLPPLTAPAQDAEALAEVLRDPLIGGFDVTTILNEPRYKVEEEIESFFLDRYRDDFLLLYFSGHGVTDDDGLLYYAARNTQHRRLRSTAVAASFVNESMTRCSSRRQVLLLDCCYSGAFARGKAAPIVNLGQHFGEGGRGRFILTSSDAVHRSFESDAMNGEAVYSVFTRALVDGLKTGEADQDSDGLITLDELYDYIRRRVGDRTPLQSPRKWAYEVDGNLVIAWNPRPVEAPLPDDLRLAMNSPFPAAKEAAVGLLRTLLCGKHRGLALAAYNALVSLLDDDSRRVAAGAAKCLEECAEKLPLSKARASAPSAPTLDVPQQNFEQEPTLPVRDPISSSSQLLKSAQDLLKSINSDPGSELLIIIPTPLIDLDDKEGKWRKLLVERLAEGGKTKIVCLSPHAKGKPSDLMEFCKRIAGQEDGTSSEKAPSAEELFDRGRKEIDFFYDSYIRNDEVSPGEQSGNKNQETGRCVLELRFADSPSELILAKDGGGRIKFFHLSSKDALSPSLPAKWSYSEDGALGSVLENLFHFLWSTAEVPPYDSRTPLQRSRDAELQEIGVERIREHQEEERPDIAPGFMLSIMQGVLPPDVALAEDDFVGAIATAARKVWDDRKVPAAERVGINVNTGTGLLALLLAKHCPVVIGMDLEDVSIDNFRENARRYSDYCYKVGQPAPKFVALQGDLLEELEISGINLRRNPLFVFDYPYYPSPSDIFHVGGNEAGGNILERFLDQAKRYLEGAGGGIVLPDADLADAGSPSKIGPAMGYRVEPIVPTRTDKYGEHTILLLTLPGTAQP